MAGLDDRLDDFVAVGAKPLAINPAPVEDHKIWSEKLGLRFPILSDPGGKIARAFEAKYPILSLVRRTVYALDPDGTVIFAERGHADLNDVMEAITDRKNS